MSKKLTTFPWIHLALAAVGLLMVIPGGLLRTTVSAQAPSPGQAGVVAAYGFEEGAGTSTADATGNGNVGTLSGTTWSGAGRFGKALSFNGTSSRVNIPDAGMLDLTIGMTIEAWVNPTALTTWRSVVMKETANGLSYALYADDTSRPAGWINIAGNETGLAGPTGLQLNTWTHLTTTYDGTTQRVYVNGTQVATRTISGSLTTSASPMSIGGNAPWGEYFAGLIDEVRVYGRALSAAEIQSDMSTPVAQGDTTPPTVSLVSPAGGSPNVLVSANVTATFSEAMNASTISGSTFELRNASNQLIPAAVTYNTTTFVATLDPTADLPSGVYTATVLGGTTDPRAKDVSGNALAANVVWSFTVDGTPPTVMTTSPAGNATNFNLAGNITATFSEAMTAATISGTTFELRNAANQIVPSTVTYNAATFTATLDPTTDLTLGATYTATVRGGAADPRAKDLVGNALAANVVWSFSTPSPTACPCSIWTPATTPATADFNDPSAIELGVKFQPDRTGYLTGIRFYKGVGNVGTHVGTVWTSTGTKLGSVTFNGESASGWQQADFSPAIPVTANTVYVASYYAPFGHYAADLSYFGAAIDNPPLHTLANATSVNGLYRYGAAAGVFPDLSYNASNYWIDVVYRDVLVVDTLPPIVNGRLPAAGATNVSPSTVVTASFNEPINPTTLTTSTFELRTPASTLVPATVSYDTITRTATLQPSAATLAPSTVYTVTVRGGATDPRVKDTTGNALAANVVWSFTTGAAPPPLPTEGPGGPILVVGSSLNIFTRYYGEILRNEGLNLFTVSDISLVTAGTLAGYDTVILGETTLTAPQVTMFTDWVNAGGNLIAMRPDKQLAGLLGITDASATLANQYLLISGSGPGAGLVNQTIQFHGTADRYTLGTATAVATLYSSATTSTTSPAVTLRTVGANGGQAAAFTYDLARSVVYSRQGNPAWSGQDRDGAAPIRANDLFFGAKAGDVQPDWIDFNKVAIPQADEQQRLLANLILQMSNDRKPVPRFWYLPRGLKAAVVMTGDDHANGGTAGRFDAYTALSPANCSVADWQCIRSTSYIYWNTPFTNAQAAAYEAAGFEVALHVTTNCTNYTQPTLETMYVAQLAQFATSYPGVPVPTTNRTHCIAWSDYVSQPKVERNHGIRLDTTYYYWPGTWILNRPGFFTGSGMPMRFADSDGSPIDVYQATSQMTDESDQTFPFTIDTLLDRALGAEAYYGVFTANMHTDAAVHAGSSAIVASAMARNVPVVSSRQMLTWLDGRNSSSFSTIGWSNNTLSFTLVKGSGATGLQGMLPNMSTAGALISLSVNGSPVPFTVQTIKGIAYAVFAAQAGTYAAVYPPPPDTTITSSPAASTTSTSASFTFTSTPSGATFQCSLDAAAYATCTTPWSYTGLALGSHTFLVRAVSATTGTDQTPASFTWTIVAPPPDTTITSSPATPTSSTSASFSFASTPTGATFECSLDAAAFAACTTPRSYTALAVGSHTFQVRAVSATTGTDPTPASFTWTITTPSAANLVAAYGFEEGLGTTTADSSGLANTGTIAGATWAATGKYGKALSFNGTSAMVTVADANSLDLTTAMTIEAWVNPTTLTNWRTILLKESPGGLTYSLYAHDGSRPNAYIRIGSNESGLQGTAALATNTWTHVASTFDGATLRLYINGALVSSKAASGALATSANALRIGGNSVWGEYFAGLIDEVRVYSRVLTAAEITADMNTPVKP